MFATRPTQLLRPRHHAKRMFDFDISPRAALAAPTVASQITVQSTVIMIVSTLSALGAFWIIASFAVSRFATPT